MIIAVQMVCCQTCNSCEDVSGQISAINFCSGDTCEHPTCSDFVAAELCFEDGFEDLASAFCPVSCGFCSKPCPDNLDTSECPSSCAHICGSNESDTIHGDTDTCSCIWGFGKNDVIFAGKGGKNYIWGGAGGDTIYGSSFADILIGGMYACYVCEYGDVLRPHLICHYSHSITFA